MIRDDQDLEIVRTQLRRMESVLDGLKRDILPYNKARYELWSEAYVDQIAALRREIDEYLASKSRAPAAQRRPA